MIFKSPQCGIVFVSIQAYTLSLEFLRLKKKFQALEYID